MASTVMFATPLNVDDVRRKLKDPFDRNEASATLMARLHYRCWDTFIKGHFFWGFFAESTKKSLVVLVMLFALSSLAILYALPH